MEPEDEALRAPPAPDVFAEDLDTLDAASPRPLFPSRRCNEVPLGHRRSVDVEAVAAAFDDERAARLVGDPIAGRFRDQAHPVRFGARRPRAGPVRWAVVRPPLAHRQRREHVVRRREQIAGDVVRGEHDPQNETPPVDDHMTGRDRQSGGFVFAIEMRCRDGERESRSFPLHRPPRRRDSAKGDVAHVHERDVDTVVSKPVGLADRPENSRRWAEAGSWRLARPATRRPRGTDGRPMPLEPSARARRP